MYLFHPLMFFGTLHLFGSLSLARTAEGPRSPLKLLPQVWGKVCRQYGPLYLTAASVPQYLGYSRPLLQVTCRLTDGDILEWKEFRNWCSQIHGHQIAVTITCQPYSSAAIRLPWPMKAHSLVSLSVENCGLEDFYREYLTTHLLRIPDSLRVLQLSNCLISCQFEDIKRVVSHAKEVSPAAHCGQLSLRKYVFRNMSYTDRTCNTTDISGLADVLLENTTNYSSDMKSARTVCSYNHLLHLDESNNRFLSKTHFYFQDFQGVYPEVRIYNLSNAGLTSLPTALSYWRFHFPKMMYLDLSRNKMSRFELTDYGLASESVGVIDLRYNNISLIKAGEIQTLRDFKTALVNIKNNPISCECGNNLALYTLPPTSLGRHEYIQTLPCYSPKALRGTPLNQVPAEQLFCTSGLPVTKVVTLTLSLILAVIVLSVFFVARYLKSQQPKHLPTFPFSKPLPAPDVIGVGLYQNRANQTRSHLILY